MVQKRSKTPKTYFYCNSRIIFEIWIPSQCEENSARVDKIGSGSFEGILVKLWSKMSKKREKCNFTVILTLFTNFEIPPIIEEYSARIDKIGLGWFGVIPVKLWSRNVPKNTKMRFYCSSRIIYGILNFYKIWRNFSPSR